MRSMRRRTSALLLAVAAVVQSGPAAAVSPVTDVDTRLVSLTATSTRTALVGTQLAAVTVEAHLVDPDPGGVTAGKVSLDSETSARCPCVLLTTRTTPPQYDAYRVLSLKRVSGTAQDGVWRGTTLLGGGADGQWQVESIIAGDLAQDARLVGNAWLPVERVLADVPLLHITSRDWPVLTISLPTRRIPAGSAYTLSGTARLATSHRPAGRLRLALKSGDCTSRDSDGGTFERWVRTDSAGRWSTRVTTAARTWCVRQGEGPGLSGAVSTVEATGTILIARVSVRAPRTVRAGQRFRVSGTLAPAQDSLTVQRRVGATWAPVQVDPIRPHGSAATWSLVLRETARGRHTYRIVGGGVIAARALAPFVVEVR